VTAPTQRLFPRPGMIWLIVAWKKKMMTTATMIQL